MFLSRLAAEGGLRPHRHVVDELEGLSGPDASGKTVLLALNVERDLFPVVGAVCAAKVAAAALGFNLPQSLNAASSALAISLLNCSLALLLSQGFAIRATSV